MAREEAGLAVAHGARKLVGALYDFCDGGGFVFCFHCLAFQFPGAAGPVLGKLPRREPQRTRARLKADQAATASRASFCGVQ